ncbi:MAG: YidC/Oxa1 family membrane protein insertase, partial [Butyrivibrio sp.]|nr:YidC/Oxa1 family membrane protein insertase [Butyrivibrio sp.]
IQELISSLSLQRIANFDFSNTSSIIDFLAALKTADWSVVSETFSSSAAVVDAIRTYSPEIIRVNSIFGVLNMSDLPLSNGFFPGVLIPVLSAVTQLISIKVSMASQPQQDNGSNPMGNMKAMNYGMVIFSMIICFTFNIGIGLYWIANAVFRTVTMVLANRVIDKKGVDKIIEENKAKKKKKEEKRGGKPSKFEEYAKMSTKNYDEQMAAAQKKKSIRELAATSTMTEAELKNKNVSKTAKTSDDAQSSNSKSNKKDKNQAGNIAAIAHMLDNDNYRKR